MDENNSYQAIANQDLRAAELMFNAGLWNHSVRHCQQYVEKILKACIELNGDSTKDYMILHSHIVQSLANRCEELTRIKFALEDKRWLRTMTSYYFDVNYPGARYISIDHDEAAEVYRKTVDFKSGYENHLTKRLDSDTTDEIQISDDPYKKPE